MEKRIQPVAFEDRPRSVTNFKQCLVAYSVMAGLIFSLVALGANPILTAFAGIFVGAGLLAYLEVRSPSPDRAGARVLRPLPPRNWSRVRVKLVGLAATLVVLTGVYAALGPAIATNAGTFLTLWPIGLIGIAIVAPVVFAETDRRMAKPEDAYAELGRALLGRPHKLTKDMLRTHSLSWVVKGFFMPLMLSWFIKLIVVMTATLQDASTPPLEMVLMLTMLMLFSIDLLGAVLGYAMTFKGFGSHIRSVNPSVTGWVAALICYPPFYYLLNTLFQHVEDLAWIDHIVADPRFVPLAIPIIGLQIVYTLGTVNFGSRFSNLTHRGIVTGGVYRWVKHPAYLAKNCFWWLMSLPFLGDGPAALWAMICIVAVNIIYFVRAKTEEIHLSADPAYRAYVVWIDEHGLFAPLKRLRRKAFSVFSPPQQERPGWRTAELT